MNDIKLTIAIAIYNLENYLEKCLESLLNQSEKIGYEILLIDDGSKDNSSKICKSYLEKGLNARLIQKENGGITSVRNLSIQEARGKYLLMIDGDDWLDEKCVEKIFSNLLDEDMLIFGFDWVYKNKIVKDERFLENKEYTKEIEKEIFKNTINTAVWNKVIKKQIIDDNNLKFLELNGAEDYLFIYDFLKNSKRVKKISDSLYKYFQRESSLSKEKSEKFYINNLIVLNTILEKENLNKEVIDYILKSYIFLIRDYRKNPKKNETIKELRKKIEKNLTIGKVFFMSNLKIKDKIRYLKIKGR